MRPFTVLLLLILASNAYCQRGPVEVSTHLDRIDYCSNFPDMSAAYVHVIATLTNHGHHDLILAKEAGQGTLIVKNMSNETVLAPDTLYGDVPPVEIADKPDPNLFQIVPPGASISMNVLFFVPISTNAGNPVRGTVVPGVYQLWATVSLLPGYIEDTWPKKASKRWKKYGDLLTSPLTVKGLQVDLELPGSEPSCDAFRSTGHVMLSPTSQK